MDLLSQRYASPYLILDDFIRLQQLHDFIYEILTTIAEERAHEKRWEYYLHRVYDITFEEYVRRCERSQAQNCGMTTKEIGGVVSDSRNILKGFVPEG